MLLRRELSYLRGEARDPARGGIFVYDAFGSGFCQASSGFAEHAGCVLGLVGLHGGLQLFDKILDAGLHGTISEASFLSLTGGFKYIFMNDGHRVFLNESEPIRTIATLSKSRKLRHGY